MCYNNNNFVCQNVEVTVLKKQTETRGHSDSTDLCWRQMKGLCFSDAKPSVSCKKELDGQCELKCSVCSRDPPYNNAGKLLKMHHVIGMLLVLVL
jgi:hypothetical protein